METVFVFPFFSVTFALIVTVPFFFAVIFPFLSTAATDFLPDVYVIFFTLSRSSLLLNCIFVFFPALMEAVVFFTATVFKKKIKLSEILL